MQQEIYLIGLNHRCAEVEIREKYALNGFSTRDLGFDDANTPIQESLLLSTCNRVELLLVAQPDSNTHDLALQAWAKACGQSAEDLSRHVYHFQGLQAVEHLFTVACSLDSMVVGEPQILGQLKEAYQQAVDQKSARVIINRLMHKAFSVAKRVRTETRIANSAVSISYAAVQLAKQIFGDLDKQTAMLVGAGEMAELAATHLLNSGIKKILVSNRTFSRAQELAQGFQGQAVDFENFFDSLQDVDIIISSTGASQTIIQAKDVGNILKIRKYKPMFFIDIAVPRDIDPDVNNLDNVYLYDIDDLKEVVEGNLAQRQQEAKKAQAIIEDEVDQFNKWLSSLELKPTIVDLLSQGEDIASRELSRTLKKLGPDVSPEVKEALETMAFSLSKKLYHEPISFLKRRAQESDSAKQYISLTRRMFNLDNENIPEDAHLNKKQTTKHTKEHEKKNNKH
jgi:glutamyl-tRNA reductase